jgi:hypothetical protein
MAVAPWAVVSILAVVAVSGSGCGSRSDTPRWGTDLRGGPTSSVTVRVENRSMGEVSLFAFSAGSRIRLGTLSGMANSTVRIPWSGFGPVSILIDQVGRGAGPFETNTLDVREGEVIHLRIEDPLEASDFYK